MKRLLMIGGALLLLMMATGGWWWYAERQAAEARLLRASGMLEATEVALSSELGGRLAERPVREGDRVRKGDLLAQLDVELLDHQIRTAPDLSTQLHLQRERDRQTLRAPLDGWVV